VKIEKLLERKYSPSLVGFLQAAGVLIYCGLVAVFFFYMATSAVAGQPSIFGLFLMLILLVFSAAVTGSLVFGYPAYLTLVKHSPKEALTILSYTLLYSLIIITLSIIIILAFA